MSGKQSAEFGERITFLQLFERRTHVEIPIIQRDYAHGRPTAREVRTEFLDAIFRTLSREPDHPSLPLDLDFVYGSNDQHAPHPFLPLDGQQRLTTLFLLHWYLAWVGGASDDFTARCTVDTEQGRRSRFSYAVRASSREFFDELVNYLPGELPAGKLSETIRDTSWFFRSWDLDPTITSALEVLDALHAKFIGRKDFYGRLARHDPPYITFQLLDLRRFDLSDDLYIKMNARGVPLTGFETFKARLEKRLTELCADASTPLGRRNPPVPEYFRKQIDTRWADLFWNYRDPKTKLFDQQIMNLIRTLAIVTRNPDEKTADETLEELRNPAIAFSFFKYSERGCIDERLVTTLIAVLERWCGGNKKIRAYLPADGAAYDELASFEQAISNTGDRMTYTELVQFHAYCAYLTGNAGVIEPERINEWMRIIGNLALNRDYRTVADFRVSLGAVNGLLAHAGRILEHFAEDDVKSQGFAPQQVREEKLKAQLIRKGSEWTTLILEAERHEYFRGQIEFLLKFCGVLDRWLADGSCTWSEEEDAEYRRSFAQYFAKAAAVFANDRLPDDFGRRRWARALLAVGDYLLQQGSNWSFLDRTLGPVSWKRLLRGAMNPDDLAEIKRGYVQELLHRINLETGIPESLDEVIADTLPEDEWRRLFVERHELMEYCWRGQTRWPDDGETRAYLLRGQRMNGEHAELFTYYLYIARLPELRGTGALDPFGKLDYQQVNTDSVEPFVFLEYEAEAIVLEIRNTGEQFDLKLFRRNGELPASLKARFAMNPFFEGKGNTLIRQTMWGEIITAVGEITATVRAFYA